MKIPKNLNMDLCNECRKNLKDKDYKRCGVLLDKPVVFFDYECSNCQHVGRYVLALEEKIDPTEALIHLSSLLKETSEEPIKGNIRSELNKIVGVNDLLKLGGKDAPREPPRDKPKPGPEEPLS